MALRNGLSTTCRYGIASLWIVLLSLVSISPLATAQTPPQSSDSSSTTPVPTVESTTEIKQHIDSRASSGDATVTDNAGNGQAVSGNATASATLVNVINTSAGSLSSTPVTFVRDITGDYTGNITIDPAVLTSSPNGTLTVNTTSSSTNLVNIQNTVHLSAVSGEASASGNLGNGSASSGDATALATIINLVNSSVGARNSFVGMVNVHGSLTGNILVPQSFVDSLLTNNTDMTDLPDGSFTSNVNITNTVNLSAESGQADALGNAGVSSASSGNAETSLNVFNLTGQRVIAKNSLLVFVSVLGEWVGMIVPAPAGATSAALGGGIASTSNTTPSIGDHQSTVNITNTVNASASSGDAVASDNSSDGTARSGNARASANVLNLVHSSLNLDDWFGALFINILGTWTGNFDIADTAPPANNSGGDPNGADGKPAVNDAIQAVRVFQFTADTDLLPGSIDQAASSDNKPANLQPAAAPAAVLSNTTYADQDKQPAPVNEPGNSQNGASLVTMAVGVLLAMMLAWLVVHIRKAR